MSGTLARLFGVACSLVAASGSAHEEAAPSHSVATGALLRPTAANALELEAGEDGVPPNLCLLQRAQELRLPQDGSHGGLLKVSYNPAWSMNFSSVIAVSWATLFMTGDDIVWLTPFFVDRTRVLGTLAIYLTYYEGLAIAAWILVARGWFPKALASATEVPVDLAMQALVVGLITFIAVLLYKVWLRDDLDELSRAFRAQWRGGRAGGGAGGEGGVDEAGRIAGGATRPTPEAAADAMASSFGKEKRARPNWHLVIIAAAMSPHKIAVHVSLLTSQVCSTPELLVGIVLGRLVVAGCCWLVAQVELVREVEGMVPTWCIAGCLAIWSCISLISAACF